MNKIEFLTKLSALYSAANMADCDPGQRPESSAWMPNDMTGRLFCAPVDSILTGMVEAGAITPAERDLFYCGEYNARFSANEAERSESVASNSYSRGA